ncbi:serine palmitoyltransferase 1 [Strongylocentrotus purpuratus]|uniref:Serine palmitoyltransferase 1 n=1 Tax=Strongylocentrotus purpuratus TaxID=7668 RepID=A0A7M7HE23_STRPU|nr:serine palmitoyltransferase 1 [Strongylocentrotus purpuratus]|eukprot:XP_011660643.1 PREDICTED: serine palmitoyltransferase 1 [Strongylocentrotus purpuratus]
MADAIMKFGVEPWNFAELVEAFKQAPLYHLAFEVILVVFIIRLIFSKSYSIESTVKLTEAEREQLVQEWEPEPLVPPVDPNHPALHYKVITKQGNNKLVVDGKEGINVGTFNFLGMLGRKETEDAAIQTMRKYGVGTCGPRGFFGTMDVHLNFEEKMAKHMGVEEAILYSYGFSTIASAIPAYAKKGDLVFCDEGVSFAIQMGLLASRSKLKFFKHNNMADLERLLQEQAVEDKKNPKKAKVMRKFIVVEGLYVNHGTIVDVEKLIELKYKYKVRVFMDESMSFFVLGKTGRGVTEHAGVDITDIDLISVSMEAALGTMGGFCLGTRYVVDHQRLSGLGYCFSASLPPMLASAASMAVDITQKETDIFQKLRSNNEFIHVQLSGLPGYRLDGDPISPIKHLRLEETSGDWQKDQAFLEKIVVRALDEGVVLTVARYLEEEEAFLPPPSIRIAVNVTLTEDQLTKITSVIRILAAAVLREKSEGE